MLVLARKKEEEIVIEAAGQRIVIKVVELRGDKVRLGFEAETQVIIHRREVFDSRAVAIVRDELVELTADS